MRNDIYLTEEEFVDVSWEAWIKATILRLSWRLFQWTEMIVVHLSLSPNVFLTIDIDGEWLQ